MITLALAYSPDDGTQGYTPYFYKMDVPVRVRNSISYGRAWQMLRSRGGNSTAEGPCDPYQRANSCNCSTTAKLPPNPGLADDHDSSAMPSCEPTPLCQTDAVQPLSTQSPRRAAIVLFADMQRQNLRFPIGTCVPCLRRGYGKMNREILRILFALRAVKTSLPIHILASGERYPEVEAKIAAHFPGVSYLDAASLPPVPPVPAWASKWARGSFAKLRALTLTQFSRVIVLDNDAVPLRNIDHLADAPAPALVFGWKCYPRRELRASTMVLSPDLSTWKRALALLQDESTAVYDDLGEQSVWRRLYHKVYELPARYAAMRTADLPADDWATVHIVHDGIRPHPPTPPTLQRAPSKPHTLVQPGTTQEGPTTHLPLTFPSPSPHLPLTFLSPLLTSAHLCSPPAHHSARAVAFSSLDP